MGILPLRSGSLNFILHYVEIAFGSVFLVKFSVEQDFYFLALISDEKEDFTFHEEGGSESKASFNLVSSLNKNFKIIFNELGVFYFVFWHWNFFREIT